MSVFNNGLYKSSVATLVDGVNALVQNESAYAVLGEDFLANLSAQGTIYQGEFTNPQIHDFDGQWKTCYTSPTLPIGSYWCNVCAQAKCDTAPITEFFIRVIGATDGVVYSTSNKRMYAGTGAFMGYVTSTCNWVVKTPISQAMIIQMYADAGGGDSGGFALLNPSGGVGAFGSGPSESSYYFINFKS